ncbi:MAG: leucyl aminopeptidase [Chloroflexota bacterium]
MKTSTPTAALAQADADGIIVGLFEDAGLDAAAGSVDRALDGLLGQMIRAGELKGRLGQVTIVPVPGRLKARKLAVAGLGKKDELTVDRVRAVSAEACRELQKSDSARIASGVFGSHLGTEAAAQAIVEGAILGLYRFDKYISREPLTKPVEELLLAGDGAALEEVNRGVHKGEILARATNLARDWTNEPGNYLTPARLAEVAQAAAKENTLEAEVLDTGDMEALGMGALLGVARGSCQPPKLIILKYHGDGSGPAVGFVGKGITFDSGGISIKPAEGMEHMKADMAGGAAVLAAMTAIARLGAKINVTAIVPATENLPGGSAFKPGDVLKAMNGKTIEVISTDAEGRLALADALSYAVKQGLSPIVDIATLTGACRVALSNVYSGVFGNDSELVRRVITAGEAAGERLWHMPVHDEYREQLDSNVADIKNTGGRFGGAITAALFLKEFVGHTPWVHMDIAGTSMREKQKGYLVKGASGVGVRTLVNLALSMSKDSGGRG